MRKCKTCSIVIVGRIDKQYCTPACKTKAHRNKMKPNTSIFKTNRILQNNYEILCNLFMHSKKKSITIQHLALAEKGFQFEYCTRVYRNNQGKWYRYLYDYRWMEFSDNNVVVYLTKQ